MQQAGEHDVIVVGAGPAGAYAAAALAKKSYNVLLLDRQSFPRDKTCGDAISSGAIHLLDQLGMDREVAAAEARGEFYPLTGMRLVSPSGRLLEAQFGDGHHGEKSYVAPRLYFDVTVQQHAVAAGATFAVAEVKKPLIEDGRVVGVQARSNGETVDYRAKVVIGADGVTSPIMRHLRAESEQHNDVHRAVALRAYIEGLSLYPHIVEFFLLDEIRPGYAWIFPAGEDIANIGLGMRLDCFRKAGRSLPQMLQDFLEMPVMRERLRDGYKLRDTAVWQLNFGSQPGLRHVFDGAILVGDAAGFINPITGGGIHNALISADLAAQTIDEALRRGDTSRQALEPYEERCEEALGNSMKWSFFYQRVLLRFPMLVDFLIGFGGQNSSLAKAFVSKL